MHVGDDHRIHGFRIDAGRGEIGVELAGCALALLIGAETEAGIDDDELRAGVDDNRSIGVRDLVGRQMVCDERGIDLALRRVADISVR